MGTHREHTFRNPSFSSKNEGDEGDEGHEGDEARVQGREGEVRKVRCVPWHQGQDDGRADEERHHEELPREVREQEEEPRGEEELRATIKSWILAVQKARKALSLKGMVPVNGKNAQGKALYAKAKSFYS